MTRRIVTRGTVQGHGAGVRCRGTVHGWISRGKINCRIAFVLIGEKENT